MDVVAARLPYPGPRGLALGLATHLEKHCTFLDAAVYARGLPPVEPDHELLWASPDEALAMLSHEADVWAVRRWLVSSEG